MSFIHYIGFRHCMCPARISHKSLQQTLNFRHTSFSHRYRYRGNTRAARKTRKCSLGRSWNRSRSPGSRVSFQERSTWFIKVDRGERKPASGYRSFLSCYFDVLRSSKTHERARDFKPPSQDLSNVNDDSKLISSCFSWTIRATTYGYMRAATRYDYR